MWAVLAAAVEALGTYLTGALQWCWRILATFFASRIGPSLKLLIGGTLRRLGSSFAGLITSAVIMMFLQNLGFRVAMAGSMTMAGMMGQGPGDFSGIVGKSVTQLPSTNHTVLMQFLNFMGYIVPLETAFQCASAYIGWRTCCWAYQILIARTIELKGVGK